MENPLASAPLADGSPVRFHILYRVRSSLCQHVDGDNLLHCWAGARSGEHLVTSRTPDGMIFLVIRRWRLPLGALTLVLTVNCCLMSVLADEYRLIPAILLAGIVADLL